MYDFMLWGFNARQPVPIKLSGGTLRECKSRQADRIAQGWTCAIYRTGTAPIGLRLQAAAA